MNRKTFLKQSAKVGLASSGLLLMQKAGVSAKSRDEHAKREQKFKEDWVVALMENMKEQLDEKTRCALMEACGRDCAKRGAIALAESCKGNLKKMVDSLQRSPYIDIVFKKGEPIKVSYKKCLCELVSKGPERLPCTYCECSKGWLLQMFETVTQKPIQVKIIQTIKRGGESCDFLILRNV
jgi:hypothetical protein